MLEWLKRHAWKACSRQNRLAGSNPVLSAFLCKTLFETAGELQERRSFLSFFGWHKSHIFVAGRKKKRPSGLFFCCRRLYGHKDWFYGPYGRKFCPYDRTGGERNNEQQAAGSNILGPWAAFGGGYKAQRKIFFKKSAERLSRSLPFLNKRKRLQSKNERRRSRCRRYLVS